MDRKQLAKIIIERMRKKVGASNQRELAELLGIKQPSISGAIQKGKIPDRWYDIIEEKTGVTKEELIRPPASMMHKVPSELDASEMEVFKEWLAQVVPASMQKFQEKREAKREFMRRFNTVLELELEWIVEHYGSDALAMEMFKEDFRARFPEFGSWLKKRKGSGAQDAPPQDSIADGTDG